MGIDTKTLGAASALIEPRVSALEEKVDNLPKAFVPRGRVDTVADLANIEDPEVGWVYLVGLESDPNKPEYWYTAAGTWEYLGQQITVDSTPTQSSSNPVSSGGTFTALSTKLPTYTADSTAWDTTPTANSTKPVTSGGVYTVNGGCVTVYLTQAEYDLITTPDANKEYNILETPVQTPSLNIQQSTSSETRGAEEKPTEEQPEDGDMR